MTAPALYLIAFALFGPAAPADLGAIRKEPKFEKRADLAIDYAERLAGGLSKMYETAGWDDVQKRLNEIGDAAELCMQALRDSGKNARKSPKHFKRSELKARAILRRLESFHTLVSFDDRGPVEAVLARVRKVHEALLYEIMGVK
jgi:hypothetical protein